MWSVKIKDKKGEKNVRLDKITFNLLAFETWNSTVTKIENETSQSSFPTREIKLFSIIEQNNIDSTVVVLVPSRTSHEHGCHLLWQKATVWALYNWATQKNS